MLRTPIEVKEETSLRSNQNKWLKLKQEPNLRLNLLATILGNKTLIAYILTYRNGMKGSKGQLSQKSNPMNGNKLAQSGQTVSSASNGRVSKLA